MLDRLLHHSTIDGISGERYPLKDKRKVRPDRRACKSCKAVNPLDGLAIQFGRNRQRRLNSDPRSLRIRSKIDPT
jgi:hypothetical protein